MLTSRSPNPRSRDARRVRTGHRHDSTPVHRSTTSQRSTTSRRPRLRAGHCRRRGQHRRRPLQRHRRGPGVSEPDGTDHRPVLARRRRRRADPGDRPGARSGGWASPWWSRTGPAPAPRSAARSRPTRHPMAIRCCWHRRPTRSRRRSTASSTSIPSRTSSRSRCSGASRAYWSSHPSFPARDVAELIAYVKERPGQVNYASSGNGSGQHLFMAMFARMADLTMVHLPYRGSGQATTDLLAGTVPMVDPRYGRDDGAHPVREAASAGDHRRDAIAAAARSPDVGGVGARRLLGLCLARTAGAEGNTRAIVERLHSELKAALATPEVKALFRGRRDRGRGVDAGRIRCLLPRGARPLGARRQGDGRARRLSGTGTTATTTRDRTTRAAETTRAQNDESAGPRERGTTERRKDENDENDEDR